MFRNRIKCLSRSSFAAFPDPISYQGSRGHKDKSGSLSPDCSRAGSDYQRGNSANGNDRGQKNAADYVLSLANHAGNKPCQSGKDDPIKNAEADERGMRHSAVGINSGKAKKQHPRPGKDHIAHDNSGNGSHEHREILAGGTARQVILQISCSDVDSTKT